MSVPTYSALALRKRERRLTLTFRVAVALLPAAVLLFLKWWIAPADAGSGPIGWYYPVAYAAFFAWCLLTLLALRLRAANWVPLVFTFGVLVFASTLSWIDLHFEADFIAITIAAFALGAVYSTSTLVYALLLGGSYGGLWLLSELTIPDRWAAADTATQGIIVAMAFVGCVLLERQRRESDEMAVRLQELNRQLRETSFRDPLTGLYNRRYMVEFLTSKFQLAVRAGFPLSVVLLDVDHFKKINDNLGHAVGDLVLKELAQSLRSGLRESDLASRYGGEEFVLVLPQAAGPDAAEVTRRILERVRQRPFSGVPWKVTFSAGVAEWTKGESAEAVLDRADKRLYEAKRARNLVVLDETVNPAETGEAAGPPPARPSSRPDSGS